MGTLHVIHLFASLDNLALPNQGMLSKKNELLEENFSLRSKFFPLRVETGGDNEDCRIASPENVPIHIDLEKQYFTAKVFDLFWNSELV